MSRRLPSCLTALCLGGLLVLSQTGLRAPLPLAGAGPDQAIGDTLLYLPLIIKRAGAADTPPPTTPPPATATPTASASPTAVHTPTGTNPPATATATATASPTVAMTVTGTPEQATVTATLTAPTLTGTPLPTGSPTAQPTLSPSPSMTTAPAATGTASPTTTATPPSPTGTATAGVGGPPTPTGTVTAEPTSQGGRVAFVPLLAGATSAWIAAQNVGNRHTQLAALYFDAAPAECPTAPAPFKLECSGLLKPGSNWVFTAPANAGSAVVFSFSPSTTANPDYNQCAQLQALLTRPWPLGWPSVSEVTGAFPFTWDPFHGEPVAVAVRRAVSSPISPSSTLASVYPGVGVDNLGPYDPLFGGFAYNVPTVYSGVAGMTTRLAIQNAGTECTSLELWFKAQDNCLAAQVCEVLQLAPGHITQFNASTCVPPGFVGTVWVRAAQPIAIGVDQVGPNALLSDVAAVEDPSLHSGVFNGGPPSDRLVLESPVPHSSGPSAVRVTVQNPASTASASVKVYFIDEGGSVITTQVGHPCPRGSETFEVLMPTGGVGSVRVESLAQNTPGDPFINPIPVVAEVEVRLYTSSNFTVVLEAASFHLLPPQGYVWEAGGQRVQGIPVLAFPLVTKGWPAAGESMTLGIQNIVQQPGVTGLAVLVYDQDRLLDSRCLSLHENQIAYLDLNDWGVITPGFKGSLVVSATYWNHPSPPATQLPWVVGLTAVLAGHGGPDASLGSDPATAMTGIPLPPTAGLLPPDHAALCPAPAAVPATGAP